MSVPNGTSNFCRTLQRISLNDTSCVRYCIYDIPLRIDGELIYTVNVNYKKIIKFYLLFGFTINEAIKEKTMAAVMPAAAAVSPPKSIPIGPSFAIDSLIPSVIR